MLANYPIFYIARIVLETRTPLSITTGRSDGFFELVRDANGLPAIPGSSFAGVLRHLYQQQYGVQATGELFGQAEIDKELSSQVHISWGCIHNSDNLPIEGLFKTGIEGLKKDPLLNDALQLTPMIRDHIRLTQRGAAFDQGKFDRTSLRRGHRFSIELSLWSENSDDERWNQLLALINRPDFRLGGATRRGLGALKVISLAVRQFDLSNTADFKSYTSEQFSNAMANTKGFKKIQSLEKSINNIIKTRLKLTPTEGYRFGQGTEPLGGEEADSLPLSEKIIIWDDIKNRGELTKKRYIVIPASAVKGALSHRIAFHYNALIGHFADKPQHKQTEADNLAVKTLFGFAKEIDSKNVGQVGHLLLDDLYIEPESNQAIRLEHNSIDRFTGGVIEHHLFNEEIVGQKTPLEFTLTVITPLTNDDPKIRQALTMALEDLTEGRLALGANSGRGGYGYFTGTLEWSDGGDWVNR